LINLYFLFEKVKVPPAVIFPENDGNIGADQSRQKPVFCKILLKFSKKPQNFMAKMPISFYI